jgi:hypothetical protein
MEKLKKAREFTTVELKKILHYMGIELPLKQSKNSLFTTVLNSIKKPPPPPPPG